MGKYRPQCPYLTTHIGIVERKKKPAVGHPHAPTHPPHTPCLCVEMECSRQVLNDRRLCKIIGVLLLTNSTLGGDEGARVGVILVFYPFHNIAYILKWLGRLFGAVLL